jgi:hypothetical protein
VNFQDSPGMTALHYMLKKDSDVGYFRVLLRFGARGDLEDDKGDTAAGIMSRKRHPEFKRMATELSAARPPERTEGPSSRGQRDHHRS